MDGMHGFAPVLTSFVGRASAVREVTSLLEEYRLVTLIGPGGAGKTRLASEVAARLANRFVDGAWLAELALVRDPAQVPAMAAAALGVPEQPGEPLPDVLARALGRQQLLLVLDNCEHVIDAAARLCAALLPSVDDVRILATSREPLGIAGEARYRLPPLDVPGLDAGDRDGAAVALFVDRARQVDARFALTDQNRPAVAELVRRLDGMPLAIELAAAQVETLGVAQLLTRIGDRLDLLVSGDRLASGRHRSLTATVEWSYRLLGERERRVFRWLSLFPGPFTLDGAEAVAGTDAGPAVLRLVNSSLLVPPRTSADGRSRYAMLETLRAYGAGLLTQAGEHDEAAAALAGYALRLAEQTAPEFEGGPAAERAAARWLDAEDATVDQALTWATEHDADIALRLVLALRWWWSTRGRLSGKHESLRAVAALAGQGSEGWCAVQVLLALTAKSTEAVVLEHLTAACDAITDRPPSRVLVDCLCGRSITLLNLGRFAEAPEDSNRALAAARELAYPAGVALALTALSWGALDTGDRAGAVRFAREAERVATEVSTHGRRGAGIPGPIARTVSVGLTEALIAAGDSAAAARICTAALASSRDVGDLPHTATLLEKAALLDLRADRPDEAAEHLREHLEISLRIAGAVLGGLDCCGHLCAATGRWAEAITIWSAFETLLKQTGEADGLSDARRREEPLRRARSALGPAGAQAARERGAAMSRDTAAEYALTLAVADPGPADESTLTEQAALSRRERELLRLVAQGSTDAEIAARLFISVRTVGSHLDNIRDKTGCRRRADLTRYALRAGLL